MLVGGVSAGARASSPAEFPPGVSLAGQDARAPVLRRSRPVSAAFAAETPRLLTPARAKQIRVFGVWNLFAHAYTKSHSLT